MEYTHLGSSGLKISRIAMGTMSFGEGDSDREGWPIPYEDAVPFFRQALDLGITFWDTANGYNAGTSEEAVGRALKEFTRRDVIVVATNVFFPVHDGPGGSGLSRKAIMEQIDDSLTRLRETAHRMRWNFVGEREPAWSGSTGLPQPRARRRPRPGNLR
jgi:aryl-alcohol dehydrogenase-like predicted oxidoreductase